MTCAGFGRQGCGAGMCSRRSWEGVWSLANGPAGCREAFEGWQTALSKRLESDMRRLWQARLRCRHVQPKVPGWAVEPGQRPCWVPRGFGGLACTGFGRQGCGAGMCSQRSREGLWSLANGPRAVEGWQTALSKRLRSDMHRLWQARAVEPGRRPCWVPRGF